MPESKQAHRELRHHFVDMQQQANTASLACGSPGHGSHVLRRHVLRLPDLSLMYFKDFAAAVSPLRGWRANTAVLLSAVSPWPWRALRPLGAEASRSFLLFTMLFGATFGRQAKEYSRQVRRAHIPG